MNMKFNTGPVLIFFSTLLLFSSESYAQANAFRPVKTLCGAVGADGKPSVVIDYEVTQPKGMGSQSDRFANVYVEGTYPVPNYKLIHVSGHRFRLGTQVVEQTYFRGQYMLYISIYEEVGEKLIQRAYSASPIDALLEPFRFGYELPNAESRISCYVTFANSQAKKSAEKIRKPAKSEDKRTKLKK